MSEINKMIRKETWWLYDGDFPDLHWSRLQIYDDDTAEVLVSDGGRYKFDNEEEARWFLLEDDYSSLEHLDAEDEEELGMPISSIEIPSGDGDDEIIKKMYVKRTL